MLKAWWRQKRIDIYIAAVVIPSVILGALALLMFLEQYQFVQRVLTNAPGLSLNEAASWLSLSRVGIFSFVMVIFSLLLILLLGSYLSTQNMQKELEVTRLKNEFISTVSHELKTPLTSIRLLAERLSSLKPEESGKQKEYLDFILSQSYYLTHLIGNILDFSKIEEGKARYAFEQVDLKGLLDQCLKDYPVKLLYPERALEMNISSDAALCCIDKESLSRALVNIIDNALKFSPPGGVVRINAAKKDEEIIIEVVDQGLGISETDKKRIFERFYHTGRGTGLGLTLARHIVVNGHKGKLEAESNAGKGATFRIILPILRN